MAYDKSVAVRIREAMQDYPGVTEKKMFGGVAFMVNGNMCSGVVKSELMLRVGPDGYDDARKQPHAREMDFTGKPMRGFGFADEAGFATDNDLQVWINRAYSFVKTLPTK